MENSPFNRSPKTSRSPPSTPQPQEYAADEPIEALSTSDIKGWMSAIEKALNDVCQIAADDKLNSEQKLCINTLSRRIGNGVSQMAMHYQALKQRACMINHSLDSIREKEDLACLNDFKKSIKETIKENLIRGNTRNSVQTELNPAYSGPIMVPAAKYKDLMDMCRSEVSFIL
ncbi:hypothetical protein PYW08_012958 [Mythimna loreyi]|uniref:Uncharacterized protein n=1 Tax=Mythimna loreyi TaxID=667449 RepID=A0ACC2Q3R3_9NEOP|nr:hypothetical protein PYW08_012958 [Mythimna loreyi]